MCATQGCMGELVLVKVSTFGLGGAVSIKYNCNGCGKHKAHFQTSSTEQHQYPVHALMFCSRWCEYIQLHWMPPVLDILMSLAHSWTAFQSTIERMFPIVKEMVDRMCEEAKTDMKTMNQDELGSWSRAVTSADGAWMTRGHHSKNFTFSIRNYYTGALLYRKHLC